MNEKVYNHLENVYEQANIHLIEQTNKRDQILLFYFVLLSFYITQNKSITELNNSFNSIGLVISIVIFFIGVMVIFLLIELRSWHQQYVDAAKIITYIISNQRDIESIENLYFYIDSYYSSLKKNNVEFSIKKFISGVDNKILISISIIVGATSYFTYRHFKNLNNIWIFIVITSIFIVIMTLYFYNKRLKNSRGRIPWIMWGFANSDNISIQNKYLIAKKNLNNDYITIYQKNGGVVIIPSFKNKFILIKIIRHNRVVYEFPRGFAEDDEILIDAAERELAEELNLKGKIENIGVLTTDSGLIVDNIHSFLISINDISKIECQKKENIIGYNIVTCREIETMIANNTITDNFTIAAFSQYKLKF